MDEILKYLEFSLTSKASDLFITAGKVPSFRINGQVIPAESDPVPAEQIDAFRREILGEEGEKSYCLKTGADASYALRPGCRFRLNFFTTLQGPAFVARTLNQGKTLDFSALGLPPVLTKIASLSRGLVVVTGTTGSGKSSTLGAIVNHINRNFSKHILTLEDPIEFVHSDDRSLISQREIDTRNSSFSDALRNALRENPDVIMIGEIRDSETMQTAISAALTGHLVLTTAHTTDATQTVERFINMFPEQLQEQAAVDLGMAMEAVIAQRLVPRADGKGMCPAVEILLGTGTVKKQITEREYMRLEETLRFDRGGEMTTFNRSLAELIRKGTISQEDALAASSNADELKMMLKGIESSSGAAGSAGAAPVTVREVTDMQALLQAAAKNNASDLLVSVGAPPMLRIHGAYCPMDLPVLNPLDVQRLLFSIISKTQRVDLEEKRELDFAISVKLASADPLRSKEWRRFRMNAFYQRGSLALVGRVINDHIPSPADLGLPPVLLECINKKQGLILVTGPTGSGKSTTLASLIETLNQTKPLHIITLEDPIEFVYKNGKSVMEQREVHTDTLSFSNGLRAAMREAPDVILVGEMRDMDTISNALSAAETGHLVLGTIHTNSAAQTVDRIIDTFPAEQQNQIRQQLSSSILAVVSQRLLRRVDGKGRVAAFEIMIGTPPIQALIREGKIHQLPSSLETGFKDGMITMDRSLEELYSRGLITQKDVESFKATSKAASGF